MDQTRIRELTQAEIEQVSGALGDFGNAGMAVIGLGFVGGPGTAVFGLLVGGSMVYVDACAD